MSWLRPSEFMSAPSLWKGGISGADVVQGLLGDKWFLNAIAVMASRPQLIQNQFVPTGQEEQVCVCVLGVTAVLLALWFFVVAAIVV